MAELEHEIHLLVSIARIDAALSKCRNELAAMPETLSRIDRRVKQIESAQHDASAHLENMTKERRTIEQKLEDNQAQIKKYKTQLMEVKTNKEYQAMLHEISHLEKDIDTKEERLLILMDELDQQDAQNQDYLSRTGDEKTKLLEDKKAIEARRRELERRICELEGEKPALMADLGSQLRKRYDRVLAKMHDFAVTNVIDDVCQGCFARIPPQVAVEVRHNNRIITCEACGRILVHYDS